MTRVLTYEDSHKRIFVVDETADGAQTIELEWTGGAPGELLVAASDASDAVKAHADLVCEGTDDHAQINAALGSLPADGGTVVLTAGTFHLNGSVAVPSYATLAGQGAATELRLVDSATLSSHALSGSQGRTVNYAIANTSRTGDADTNITLRDFRVEGNGANQSTTQTIALVWLHNVTDVTVENVVSRDATPTTDIVNSWRAFCLLMVEAERVQVRGGRYEWAGYECVGIRDNCYDVSVVGAVIRRTQNHAMQVASSWIADTNAASRITISDCLVETLTTDTGTGNGITLHGQQGNLTHVTLSGNTIHSHGSAGVYVVEEVTDVAITGNAIDHYGTTGCAIRLGSSTSSAGIARFTITGNVLVNDRNLTGGTSAVDIYHADDVIVSGNRVASGWHGIHVQGASTRVTVTGNSVKAQAPSGTKWSAFRIIDSASRVSVIGNQIEDATRAFSITGTTTDILVALNDFPTGIDVPGAVTTSGDVVYRGNQGYVTDATGTGTVADAASTAVVSHGLDETPTSVTVTPRGDEMVWVSARTATTFTVSRSGSSGALDFDWSAAA